MQPLPCDAFLNVLGLADTSHDGPVDRCNVQEPEHGRRSEPHVSAIFAISMAKRCSEANDIVIVKSRYGDNFLAVAFTDTEWVTDDQSHYVGKLHLRCAFRSTLQEICCAD